MRLKSKDIAKALGVSEATVSLVLNERPGVKDETRKKIIAYIEKNEKRSVSIQKEMMKLDNGTVMVMSYIKHGIIMVPAQTSNQPESEFLRKTKKRVNEKGYELLYRIFREDTDDLEALFQECKKNRVKGMYILGAEMKEGDIYPFQKLHIPIVVGDQLFYEIGMDSYLIDNQEGISRGVDYLIDRGHSNIVYLAENIEIFNFVERRKAFVTEMKRRGCGERKKYIHHLGNTIEDVYRNMNVYLDEGIRKTTAFVLESSVISVGVGKALMERNIKIPRDISLIGFDAVPELHGSGINLTMIKGTHTKRHMAAVSHLLRHLTEEGEDEIVRIYYRTRMIEGDSVFDKKKFIYI